jgi:hypothetical protein
MGVVKRREGCLRRHAQPPLAVAPSAAAHTPSAPCRLQRGTPPTSLQGRAAPAPLPPAARRPGGGRPQVEGEGWGAHGTAPGGVGHAHKQLAAATTACNALGAWEGCRQHAGIRDSVKKGRPSPAARPALGPYPYGVRPPLQPLRPQPLRDGGVLHVRRWPHVIECGREKGRTRLLLGTTAPAGWGEAPAQAAAQWDAAMMSTRAARRSPRASVAPRRQTRFR